MKLVSMIVGVVLLCAVCAQGRSYIVTANGDGVWASSVRTVTNVVVYYVAEGGETEQSCAMQDLVEIVPTVQRGRQYTEREIGDAIGMIEKLALRFFKLRKSLIVLNQQWQALRAPETGVEERIGALVRTFEAGAKDPAAFRDVSLQMDMVRFKDMSGKYSNQVGAALVKIGSAYFEANRGKVDRLLNANDTSVSHFMECKKEVVALKLGFLSAAQKQQLDAALQKCCDATIKAGTDAAKQSLSAAKTVDSYLEGSEALRVLKRATAENATPKDAVDRAIFSLRGAAAEACPGYDFSFKGCPLSEDDRKILAETKKFASSTPIRSIGLDEQAYMFPSRMPGPPEGDTFRQPFRIVFNRTQPKGREYIIGGELRTEGEKPKTFLWRIPPLEISDGHTETTLEAPASRLAGANVSIFLACADDTVKEGEPAKWIALSLGCPISMGKTN